MSTGNRSVYSSRFLCQTRRSIGLHREKIALIRSPDEKRYSCTFPGYKRSTFPAVFSESCFVLGGRRFGETVFATSPATSRTNRSDRVIRMWNTRTIRREVDHYVTRTFISHRFPFRRNNNPATRTGLACDPTVGYARLPGNRSGTVGRRRLWARGRPFETNSKLPLFPHDANVKRSSLSR